jgi:hypothetical protein
MFFLGDYVYFEIPVYDDNGNFGRFWDRRQLYSNIDRYILIYFGKDLS